MNWDRIRAVVAKDLRELAGNRLAVLPMVMVPLIMSVVLPCVVMILAFTLDVRAVSGMEQMERIIPFYPVPAAFDEPLEKVVYIFLNYTFIPLFMVIPLMVSSIVAASSVVGEKERHTLETLLYTPITQRELVTAKIAASFLPAVALGVIAFAAYFAAANTVSLALRGLWIVRSWIWLPAVLLLAPSVSLVGLSVTLIVSLKAKSFMEAQQMSALVVVPFVALLIAQIAGAVTFRALYVVLASLALFGIGLLILLRIAPRFTRENIIRTL